LSYFHLWLFVIFTLRPYTWPFLTRISLFVSSVKADTEDIKAKNDTLIQEVQLLRPQVVELCRSDNRTGFMLQRFLDESTAYAESVVNELDIEDTQIVQQKELRGDHRDAHSGNHELASVERFQQPRSSSSADEKSLPIQQLSEEGETAAEQARTTSIVPRLQPKRNSSSSDVDKITYHPAPPLLQPTKAAEVPTKFPDYAAQSAASPARSKLAADQVEA
jgi:hypothetical protein